MSHHYSGPNLAFPGGDARLDFTDLYAFPKPGDAGRSILIMDFHPSVGLAPPGPTIAEPFAPAALYELRIDTNGDADISVVLEVPNSALGSKEVGLWARTLIPAAGGGWVQADRGAKPSQTPFLSGEQNEAYRAGEPAEDGRFVAVFAHSLEHTGGYSPEAAQRVAQTLLPDLIRYDPTRPASYPQSGRTLTDDVVDGFLPILTNGKVKGDGVGPHHDLLTEFPYLGPPHQSSR